MWQMENNDCTKFQNGVLPCYNKLGSGQTWHDAYECTEKAIWHEFAAKSNASQEKKDVTSQIEEALEAGVPGMEAVAENFIKQQFAPLYGPNAPVLGAGARSNALTVGAILNASVTDNIVVSAASN
jgi:hypothetical protein